jgi:hypothetical protein
MHLFQHFIGHHDFPENEHQDVRVVNLKIGGTIGRGIEGFLHRVVFLGSLYGGNSNVSREHYYYPKKRRRCG